MKKLKELDWCEIGYAVVIIAIVITILFVVIAGIAASIENEKNKITEGIIIDKSFSAAYTTYTSTRIGETTVMQPHYHPARYSFQLQGEKNEKTVTYWLEVSKEDYNEYRIGNYYKQ